MIAGQATASVDRGVAVQDKGWKLVALMYTRPMTDTDLVDKAKSYEVTAPGGCHSPLTGSPLTKIEHVGLGKGRRDVTLVR